VYWPILQKKFEGADIRTQRRITCAVRSTRAGSESLNEGHTQRNVSVNVNLPLLGREVNRVSRNPTD
jgi:hypothetical protein